MKNILTLLLLLLFTNACTTTTVEEPAPPYQSAGLESGVGSDSAENQGFDPDMLAQIPTYVEDGYSHLFSVLVLRNGELVSEWYADDQNADTPAVAFSVTKSFMSALIGIALEEGLIDSVQQTLGELIPLSLPVDGDPRTADITLKQLLTMTSGMYCSNDSCHGTSIPEATSRELELDPGTQFVYDTGASHLLSAVLEEATGMTAYEYAEQKLFTPLGFEGESWDTDSDGVYFGGKGLNLRPRDMAKFGQLFLDEGQWDGVQLVSADYIRESTTDRLDNVAADGEYGYLWWPGEVEGHTAYSAVGYGGQYITVVPDLELVVVITSNYWRQYPNNNAIIEELIVPAIVN
ncbi:MAG: serine hydrolase domain-containing protein [Candidatus Promineifilaceae bacterium]